MIRLITILIIGLLSLPAMAEQIQIEGMAKPGPQAGDVPAKPPSASSEIPSQVVLPSLKSPLGSSSVNVAPPPAATPVGEGTDTDTNQPGKPVVFPSAAAPSNADMSTSTPTAPASPSPPPKPY